MLARRYRLVDRLQAVADGSVWHATDETLQRQVSVRVLGPTHPHAADVVDAARRAALVEDPRLVRVLDVGTAGVTYIVSEHVRGRPLAELVSGQPLPAETVRRIVGEAAQAIDRAGARGLHHLRLTPNSVVIQSDGSIKIVGTAIEAALIGIEPDDAAAAARTDTVGLISLLYAGLTGRWPGSSAETTVGALTQGGAGASGAASRAFASGSLGLAPQVGGRPVSPGELVAGVPSDLDTLCSVTLGPHDDGPQTPGELVAQLAPWAEMAPLTDPRGLTVAGPARPIKPTPPAPVQPAPVQPAPVRPAQAPRADPGTPRPNAGSARLEPTGAPKTAEISVPELAAAQQIAQQAASRQAATEPRTPTPAPAGERRSAPGLDVDLASELLGGPSEPAVQRLDPAPPPQLSQVGQSWRSEWGQLGDQERLGPFLPPTPMGRPPQEQTRLVIMIMAGLVVVGLILAMISLRGLLSADPLNPSASPGAVGSLGSASSPTGGSAAAGAPSTAATSTPAGSALEIAEVVAIDPQGDGSEYGSAAARVIDGDGETTWRSERYATAAFSGAKEGVGLVLDLGSDRPVSQVSIEHLGSGGVVQFRQATDPSLDGSSLVATGDLTGGALVLKSPTVVRTRYILLWFTQLTTQSDGTHRLLVSQVSVR